MGGIKAYEVPGFGRKEAMIRKLCMYIVRKAASEGVQVDVEVRLFWASTELP